MRYSKILLILGLVGIIGYSCKKSFLDKAPLGVLSEETLSNKNGVEALLIGAYSLLDGYGSNNSSWASAGSNWVYGSMCGSEAYKGSDAGDQPDANPIEIFSPTAANPYFVTKWSTVYDAVGRTNDVLRIAVKATDIGADDMKRITGEARFLRAFYHMEAKKMWNKVPFVDETVTYNAGNFHIGNDADIWPNIEADLQYAIDNLPETQDQVGRTNKWVATGYLAKAKLFQGDYAAAKPLLESIINSGKYSLQASFADNFNIERKNSKESLFAAQSSVNDGSNGNNGNWGDVLNFPYSGGPGGCCGFFQPSQYLVNHCRVDAAGLPFLDTYNSVDVKSDQGLKSGDPFTPEAGFLDPRLDWTVGRRGIPYLDWGNHPGNDWIRDQGNGGPYTPKKNVYYKAQEGKKTDASFWTSGVTANNINLMRYADILLWAAECEVEVGVVDKAREYVNLVRQRAADPSTWVKTAGGANAANYKIGLYTATWTDQALARKAVHFERTLELGMEGVRFFDMVRWNVADVEINAYFAKEKSLRSYMKNAVFTKGKNEYYPIPQDEIDRVGGGLLKQNPGY